jgi:hypothetical protein
MIKLSLSGVAGVSSFGLASSTARAIDYTEPVPEAKNLTAYLKDQAIQVRWQNLPLTVYRAGHSQKYPYFHPLNGPLSGLSLTTESSLPYPHHRGLWFSCDPVNGGNYWADDGLTTGQVRSVELQLKQTTSTSATFSDQCLWVRPGAPSPLKDERSFVLTVANERLWHIDIDITLTANEEDVTIRRAKHSLFALRAAVDISPIGGGVLINSEGGQGAKGTYGKTADWCGFYGKRKLRADVVEGISVMNHPKNFAGDCPWFTREYGHLSPSPFNFQKKPWRLEKSESVRLRYRVALHAGDPQEAQLDRVYRQWLEG